MNDILLGATTFRFDGSDLMPGGVGAGSSGPAWSTTPAASRRGSASEIQASLGRAEVRPASLRLAGPAIPAARRHQLPAPTAKNQKGREGHASGLQG
jgi:hypothetical protein